MLFDFEMNQPLKKILSLREDAVVSQPNLHLALLFAFQRHAFPVVGILTAAFTLTLTSLKSRRLNPGPPYPPNTTNELPIRLPECDPRGSGHPFHGFLNVTVPVDDAKGRKRE